MPVAQSCVVSRGWKIRGLLKTNSSHWRKYLSPLKLLALHRRKQGLPSHNFSRGAEQHK